jgi:hypothetical protein
MLGDAKRTTIAAIAREALGAVLSTPGRTLRTTGWQLVGLSDIGCDTCEAPLAIFERRVRDLPLAVACPHCGEAWSIDVFDDDTVRWIIEWRHAVQRPEPDSAPRANVPPHSTSATSGLEAASESSTAPTVASKEDEPKGSGAAPTSLRELSPELDDLLFGVRRSPIERARALEAPPVGTIDTMATVVANMHRTRQKSGIRRCQTCDRTIPPNLSACVRCDDGVPAGGVADVVCSRCGHWNSGDDRRCAACYKRLKPVTQ